MINIILKKIQTKKLKFYQKIIKLRTFITRIDKLIILIKNLIRIYGYVSQYRELHLARFFGSNY